MDIVPIYKRVIGLDVHQAQITGCAITEQPDGSVRERSIWWGQAACKNVDILDGKPSYQRSKSSRSIPSTTRTLT